MSAINKTPYIETVVASLTKENLTALQSLLNGTGTKIFRSFINQTDVMSTEDKGVADKLTNYKEHAYMAQEIINKSPEIKEKIIFLIEHYPDSLLAKLVEIPTESLEEIVKQYEEEKSQG
jgi:hypothetical protein